MSRLASVFAAVLTLAASPAPAAEYPPHTVPGTELRVLPRVREDRLYQLHIALPAGFHENPDRRYPVVFVTDGYWDFTTVVATYGNLFYGKNVPAMIIVGLGYAGENLPYDELRVDDLTPMGDPGRNGGHAGQFLKMLEEVAFPLLEKEYRADPGQRYLMGCSNGGLFTLFALFTRPELFKGYVADSPAVFSILGYERAFAAAGRTTEARVFLSAAQNEWPTFRNLIRTFYRRLEKEGVVKGGLAFRQVDNVRHAGTKPEIYTQGLLFVTEPIAPETGAQADEMPDSEGRPIFSIQWWPAKPVGALSEADHAALRDHEAWLGELSQQKQVSVASVTPGNVKERYSGVVLHAKDQSKAEALAASAPAVKAGVLKYEVMAITE